MEVRIEAGEMIAHIFELGRDYDEEFDDQVSFGLGGALCGPGIVLCVDLGGVLCGPGIVLCVGLGGVLCLKRYKFRDVMLAHIVCIYDGMVYTYTVELIKPASTLATKKPYILYAYSE